MRQPGSDSEGLNVKYNPQKDSALWIGSMLALMFAFTPAIVTGTTILSDMLQDGFDAIEEKGPGWVGLIALSAVLVTLFLYLGSQGAKQHIAEREASPFL